MINLGVPQEPILGPLLFLIYIIDLPKCLSSGQAITLADGSKLSFNNVSYTELVKKANEKLHKVDSWLTANKLTLNIEKTKVITFKTRNSPPVPSHLEIKLNGNALDKVTCIRFLGIGKLHVTSHIWRQKSG